MEYEQSYEYDGNYRLIASNGSGMGSNFAPEYKLRMEYSPAGRIQRKYLTGEREDNKGLHTLDYDNRYFYNSQSNNPYAVDLIQNQRGGEDHFKWDKKGNMITHYEEINDNVRRFSWTEDNRLEAVLDKDMGAFYSYDAAGERHYKLTGATVSVSQNGNSVNAPVFDRQTLYASPLITITDKGYTKHYFEEGNRICSSIGGGRLGLVDEAEPIVTPWDECKTALSKGVLETYRQNFAVEPHTDDIVDLYETVEYWSGKDTDEPTFYYHPDHLGSATLITDDAADVVQQIAYLPYGEDWVDIRHHGYFGSAYKFNGKEKDDETGYSYYGARYYTDRLSIWLSVDPLADKYPHLSPYAYCSNNPVNAIDPDGREGIVISGGEYDGNRYKYNFIEPAITRLKQLKEAGGDEPITWAVMTAGYSDDDIAKFQSIAGDLGVGFQSIGSADELTNYLNSKDIGVSNLSEARQGDQITSMSVFGHGFAGSAEFAYNQDKQTSFSWSKDNVKQLNKGAFNNAAIDLYTCNSATNTANGTSLANDLSARTGSTVTGYRGQSTYRKMNEGQGWRSKWNRSRNGFNTNGSIKLPQAGDGAIRIKYIPVKKK